MEMSVVHHLKNLSKSKLCNTFILLFPLIMVLLQYSAIFLTYGALICVIFVAAIFVKNKNICIDKDFLVLCGIIIIQQFFLVVIGSLDVGLFMSNTCMILVVCLSSGVSIYVSKHVSDAKSLDKYFENIAYFFSLVLLGQFIYGMVTGKQVSSIIILPLSGEQQLSWGNFSFSRPSTFFSEPSAYTGFLAPFLILSIDRGMYKLAAILTTTFLLSSSTQGIIVALFIWGYYMVVSDKVKSIYKILVVLLAIITVYLFMTLEPLTDAKNKFFSIFSSFRDALNLNMSNQFSYTNYLRLFKGWDTYIQMPLLEKIIGIGMNNFSNYLFSSKMTFSWQTIFGIKNTQRAYFSSISGVLIECGFPTAFVYYIYLVKKIITSDSYGRGLYLAFVVESFVGNMFFNSIFLFYILYLYLFIKPKYCVSIKI